MLIEHIVGNQKNIDLGTRSIDPVRIEWYELEKKLLRKTSEQGEDVGIRVNDPLCEGDILYMDEKKALVLELLPCELTVIPVESMQQMGRLCFELGNRHLSLSIEEHQVSVVYDAPTFEYLQKLGFYPQKKTAQFQNVTVCHAHSHTHANAHTHTHAEEHE